MFAVLPQDELRPTAGMIDITDRLCHEPPVVIGSTSPTATPFVSTTVTPSPSPGFNDMIEERCRLAFITGDVARACCPPDGVVSGDAVDCLSYYQVCACARWLAAFSYLCVEH
jgi:hypothetical protein